MRRSLIAIALTPLLALAACKAKPISPAEAPQAQAVPALDPSTLGKVEGTVSFQGKAPPPLSIDTSMDPACGLSGGNPVSEQYLVKAGKLANVFLTVKSGPPAAMNAPAATTAPIVLDQKGCIYTPHVVAIQKGGAIEFHNDDPTMHNIHTMPTTVGNTAIDVSQSPHGAPQIRRFAAPETMIPVRCNNHPWMNAFINVAATPFFAISDSEGRFTLNGLPPGDYTLSATHEKLGEQTLQVTVKSQTTAKADLAFAQR